MRVGLITTDGRHLVGGYEAPDPSFGAAPQALLQGFARMREVEIHVISCVQRPVKSPARLADNIFFHGVVVPKIGWLRTGYQGCIRAVRRKLREIGADIVHGQGTERDCGISACLSGRPNVITIHGNMAELARLFRARIGSFSWLAARLETFALKRTMGVFCNSGYTESLVRPRARRIWRVPNPIREEFFASAAPVPAPARAVLLNVGVICERKRQLELLDVARKLHEQGLEFEFQFVGLTPRDAYGNAFLEKIKPMTAAGYASIAAHKPTGELIARFDQASALVHFPSEEAFGLVVAEALARRLKFFGARLGGVAEIAEEVPGAELFASDDWEGLTAGIARWIRGGFPRLGSDTIMHERYHPDVIARRHIDIYREVLRSRS